MTPHWVEDEHGAVQLSSIATYGDTLHLFVQREGYDGRVPAGLRAPRRAAHDPPDAGAVRASTTSSATSSSATWRSGSHYYERVFGMTEMIHFSDEAISTEYSALMSKVVTDGTGRIKFPINEPAEGKRKSQIEEYLEFYRGAGAQHIAVATRDIVGTRRRRCASSGVEFLTIPDVVLRRGAGADRRDRGGPRRTCAGSASWSTATTRATCCRSSPSRSATGPTVFFEIIERHGARGFGEGNFKALFEAIEREQDRRGNL